MLTHQCPEVLIDQAKEVNEDEEFEKIAEEYVKLCNPYANPLDSILCWLKTKLLSLESISETSRGETIRGVHLNRTDGTVPLLGVCRGAYVCFLYLL